MKLPYNMWMVILTSIANNKSAIERLARFNDIAESSGLKQYDVQTIHSIDIKEVAESLKDIDVEKNINLKTTFFKEWKNTYIHFKIEFFKGRFAGHEDAVREDLITYYLKNMVSNPTVAELFRFSKTLNKNELKQGILNFCLQPQLTKRNVEDCTNPDETRQLLGLMRISDLTADEWEKIKSLKFKNLIYQAEFESMAGISRESIAVETKNKEAYIISVKIDKLSLIEPQRKMGESLLNICEELSFGILRQAIGLPQVRGGLPEFEKMNVFIAYDKESYISANARKDLIIKWMSKNRSFIIAQAEDIDKRELYMKSISSLDVNELVEKILLTEKLDGVLENKPTDLNKKSSAKI